MDEVEEKVNRICVNIPESVNNTLKRYTFHGWKGPVIVAVLKKIGQVLEAGGQEALYKIMSGRR